MDVTSTKISNHSQDDTFMKCLRAASPPSILLLFALCFPVMISCIDIMAITVALNDIMRDTHASIEKTQWLISAYTIGIASFLIIIGRLADKYGRKRLLSYGVILFGVASLICALSSSIHLLIVGRFLQGVASSMLMTTALALITNNFPVEKRAMAFGQWGTALGIGLAIGPLVGATIIALANWRWIFIINLPLCVLAYYLARNYVKEFKNDISQTRINGLSATLLSILSVGITLAFSENSFWTLSYTPLLIIILFTILLFIFIKIEKRSAFPLIDLALFKYKNYSSALLASSISYFCLYAWLFLFNLYLQSALNYSYLKAGLILTSYSVAFAINSTISGKMMKRFGNKLTMQYGFVVMTIALVLLSLTQETSSVYFLLFTFFIFGVGVTSSLLPSNHAATEFIPPEKSGVASGMIFTCRWLGGSIGVALTTIVFNTLSVHNQQSQSVIAMTHGLFVSCLMLALISAGGLSIATMGLNRISN